MLTLRFTETGKEFQVSYELLRQLAKDLPKTENYGELASALVDLGIPSVTCHLLGHEAVRPRHDALWEGGDRGIRQALVQESAFRRRLTDKQAQDIIDMNDRGMLANLAPHMNDVLGIDDDVDNNNEDKEPRISCRICDKLVRFLRDHEDPRIKEAIARASMDEELITSVAEELCVPFAECLQLGIDCGNEYTMATMRPADVEQLRTAPYSVLERVAQWAESVTDAAAQEALLHSLTTHPDPAMRLALARNYEMPREALERLCADADADVAHAARESLELREILDRSDEDDFDD